MKALRLLVSALALVCVAGTTGAQESPVDLKLAHWLPPKHPLHPAFEAWAASLKQASGGTLNSSIFPAEQLGKAFDHYDMARDGIADFTYVNPGYQPGRFPVIAAGELPFSIANAKGGSAAFDSWYRKYAEREMKDVHFCFAFVHDPGTLHARRKITTPDQIKGLKLRPSNATMGQFFTLLGGTNVQASAPEAREMLERGVADAIVFPWGSIVLFGIDKVVKYHVDAPVYVSTFVWVMNKARYDALAPGQKKAVDAHCTTEWAEKVATPWADFEAGGRDKLKAAAGHEVYPLSAAELDAWKEAAARLEKNWAEAAAKSGIDAGAVLSELKASLAQRGAGY